MAMTVALPAFAKSARPILQCTIFKPQAQLAFFHQVVDVLQFTLTAHPGAASQSFL